MSLLIGILSIYTLHTEQSKPLKIDELTPAILALFFKINNRYF